MRLAGFGPLDCGDVFRVSDEEARRLMTSYPDCFREHEPKPREDRALGRPQADRAARGKKRGG